MSDNNAIFEKSVLTSINKEFKSRSNPLQSDRLLKSEFIRKLCKLNFTQESANLWYNRIDVNEIGYITQSHFMMFIAEYESAVKRYQFEYQPKFIVSLTQKPVASYGHSDAITCLSYSGKPSPLLFSGGVDGLIYIWKANTLTPISIIKNLNRNAAIQEDIHKRIKNTPDRNKVKVAESNHRLFSSHKATSITALHKLSLSSHLCIGSADCSLIFYDLLTMTVHGRVTDLRDPISAITSYTLQSLTNSAPTNAATTTLNVSDSNVTHTTQMTHWTPRSQRSQGTYTTTVYYLFTYLFVCLFIYYNLMYIYNKYDV